MPKRIENVTASEDARNAARNLYDYKERQEARVDPPIPWYKKLKPTNDFENLIFEKAIILYERPIEVAKAHLNQEVPIVSGYSGYRVSFVSGNWNVTQYAILKPTTGRYEVTFSGVMRTIDYQHPETGKKHAGMTKQIEFIVLKKLEPEPKHPYFVAFCIPKIIY